MAAESLSGHLLLRPLATDLFGTMTKYYGGETVGVFQLKEEFRLGLVRAYGPFDHPILGGTIMTGFLPLYYYSGLRGWPLVLGMGAALCGLFSLSSAAFLGVFLMIAAIAINYALPYIPKLTWWMIITMSAMVLTALHFISTNGIVQVISRLTLTPGTAFYRIYIWRYGIANVEKYPIFGIGYSQWERPAWMISDSIDAHFLALAVTYGLLVPVLLLAGIGFGMIRIGRIMNAFDVRNRNMLLGLNIAVFVYVIVGQTVAFFSTGVVVFMVMVGFMASMASWAEYQYKTDRQKALMRSRAMLYASQAAAAAR
jgi:O-antigen ligase